jgi:hypothetical protein
MPRHGPTETIDPRLGKPLTGTFRERNMYAFSGRGGDIPWLGQCSELTVSSHVADRGSHAMTMDWRWGQLRSRR